MQDGACEEWVDEENVRPLPPVHDPSFILNLKKGQPLEINLEGGWWEVEMSGREGPKYVVTSKRYKVAHVGTSFHLACTLLGGTRPEVGALTMRLISAGSSSSSRLRGDARLVIGWRGTSRITFATLPVRRGRGTS